jgi:hypothetical protein
MKNVTLELTNKEFSYIKFLFMGGKSPDTDSKLWLSCNEKVRELSESLDLINLTHGDKVSFDCTLGEGVICQIIKVQSKAYHLLVLSGLRESDTFGTWSPDSCETPQACIAGLKALCRNVNILPRGEK